VPVVLAIAELPVRYRAVALLETFVTCGGPHLFRPSPAQPTGHAADGPLAAGTMTTTPCGSHLDPSAASRSRRTRSELGISATARCYEPYVTCSDNKAQENRGSALT